MSEVIILNKIYSLIPKIMSEMDAIGKKQKNKAQGWNFRGIDDVYNALQKLMGKHEVFNTVKITETDRKEVTSARGAKGIHALYKYTFKFYGPDGSFVEMDSIGEGIDFGGDKVSNKCASIAHKYALLQIFCIATEDMAEPDKEVHEIKSYDRPKNTKQYKKPVQNDILPEFDQGPPPGDEPPPPFDVMGSFNKAVKTHDTSDFDMAFGEHVCQVKKFKDQLLKDVPPGDIIGMLSWFDGAGSKYASNANAKDFLKNAYGYLKAKQGDALKFAELRKKYPSEYKKPEFVQGMD